jgi:hypothetical protein
LEVSKVSFLALGPETKNVGRKLRLYLIRPGDQPSEEAFAVGKLQARIAGVSDLETP